MAELPPLADISRLAVKLGLGPDGLSGNDADRAEEALAEASTLARDEAGQEWADGVAPAPVATVVLQAAKREFQNPEGLVAETAGPFSKRRDDRQSTGVYFTEAELAIVRRFRTSSRGLWTQQTTRGDDEIQTVFLEDNFGFELFPSGNTNEGVW